MTREPFDFEKSETYKEAGALMFTDRGWLAFEDSEKDDAGRVTVWGCTKDGTEVCLSESQIEFIEV